MRYVLSVVLLTTCALFAGVCHGPHGLAAATAVTAAPPVHHVCPGPDHSEHAGTGHPAALAAQPADRERPDGAGGKGEKTGKGALGGDPAADSASGVTRCAPPRAGPCCPPSGQRLLLAIGVDRN
ncbi:hypothetical protein GCM10010349_74740 [Streptomyces flavofungini]|uniref:hypothetical protein n=1 Tax=Streptomyces flavofungini TaxID=68200 RepID=UPI0018E90DA6|nr:hypothetical protein [Streptomyces flavofungini]GHC87832.1 hypothetical protein GCM10010349_74740 [Streptomyces flavofungini]